MGDEKQNYVTSRESFLQFIIALHKPCGEVTMMIPHAWSIYYPTTSKEAEDRLDVQLQHNSDKAILSI